MNSDKTTELNEISVSKRYKLGNKNKSIESHYIESLLNSTDLIDEHKFYIKTRYLDAIFALDRLAVENKAVFQVARSLVLIVGVLIPALVNIEESILPDKTSKIIVTILSVLSSVLFGVLQIWKHDIIWAHHRLQFELMRSELYRFLLLSGDVYSKYSTQSSAFKEFVSISENKFDEEIKLYFNALQLDAKLNVMNLNSEKLQ